ncbi:DUF389 domain-containing protein [Pedomonas sp. V897]|uniref:DUF389 domain-containing protein n=1 Tax=Pedomonas sp. V897 TaxID=3446482 RepID=UPI003EE14589
MAVQTKTHLLRQPAQAISRLKALWREYIITNVDHEAVVRRVTEEARWSSRYAFMVVISAGISILGLLLPSSAVLIGAMLISPLMMPIIGLGFALATFDVEEMKQAAFALAAGSLLAIVLSALFVAISPVQTVTSEIASRTQPNLFDLLVALLSALAGGYALVRGRGETVVGVAIAIALMPPLAVVGFGLATQNWYVAGGALLLFFTNLITIALTAAFVARLYGFGSHLSPAHTHLQTVLIVVILAALATPLGLTLKQIGWETLASRQIRDGIRSHFPSAARLSDVESQLRGRPIKVTATVLTPRFIADADEKVGQTLTRLLNRHVVVHLDQLIVGGAAGDAQAAQLAAAQNRERLQADRITRLISDRLALAGGGAPRDVLIDQIGRRATITARPLAGSTLATYHQLEQRAASGVEDWTLMLVPPLLPLPEITFAATEAAPKPDAAGENALDIAAWAILRRNVPVSLSGPAAVVDAAAAALALRGVESGLLDLRPDAPAAPPRAGGKPAAQEPLTARLDWRVATFE